MPWELPALLGSEAAREGLRRLQLKTRLRASLKPDPGGDFERIASLEASHYMRNQLLRDADWAGMAHSMEIRVPLVDSVLLQRVAPFLIRSKESNKKFFLAGAAKKNRASLKKRSKTGFSVPMARWLSEEKAASLDAWKDIKMLQRPETHWSRRWAYTAYQKLAA